MSLRIKLALPFTLFFVSIMWVFAEESGSMLDAESDNLVQPSALTSMWRISLGLARSFR